jgi:hypothetical protein
MGTIISTVPPASKITSIFKSTKSNFSSNTGGTSEFLTGFVLVPAGSIVLKEGMAEITARFVKTGTAGTLTARIYVNTTEELDGSQLLLATSPAVSPTNLYLQLERTLFISGSPDNTQVVATSSATYTDTGTGTGAQTSLAIDWSEDQYILVTVQNGSAADITSGDGLFIKLYNK